ELIKKDAGVNPLGLTSQEKTKVVDALRNEFPLANLLRSLKPARSTYFYRRMRQTLPEKYAQVRATIRYLFEDNYRCYGYRRMYGALRREGVRVSEKVVRRQTRLPTCARLSPSTPPAFHRDCNFLFYPTAGVIPVRKPGATGLHHHDAHPGAKPALNSGGPRRDRAGQDRQRQNGCLRPGNPASAESPALGDPGFGGLSNTGTV